MNLKEVFNQALNAKAMPPVKSCSDPNKTKILFICSQNLRRSKTAEDLYCEDYNVQSAGFWCKNTRWQKEISKELLDWADKVFVFEQLHLDELEARFGNDYSKQLINLDILDNYSRGDSVLCELIKKRAGQIAK